MSYSKKLINKFSNNSKKKQNRNTCANKATLLLDLCSNYHLAIPALIVMLLEKVAYKTTLKASIIVQFVDGMLVMPLQSMAN